MQILSKTNPSETKVTNTGVLKPPQIRGSAVSRSRGLENNFFLHPKPFSENSRTGDSKNVRFLRFQPFLAKKMALEVKKARFNPFVLPSDFFKSDGDPVYPVPEPWGSTNNKHPVFCTDTVLGFAFKLLFHRKVTPRHQYRSSPPSHRTTVEEVLPPKNF